MAEHMVFFEGGERFSVRYYLTTEVYAVELPCGTYESPSFSGLRRQIAKNFIGAKIAPATHSRAS